MVTTPPTPASRARGALLGHAAGNALGLATEPLGTASAIAGRFPDGVTEIIRADTAGSPFGADVALAVILAEELLEPEVDLRRLAYRWVEWMRTDGRGIGEWTRIALAHIAQHDSPPAETGGRASNGAVSRCLPVALATSGSPRNLLAATVHTAALTHPDPRCVWSAVAVNVAAARFLQGKRDFVPDVVEALRNNDAPSELLDAVRRVPFERRDELQVGGAGADDAVRCAEIALWFAFHEPSLERGLVWLAGAGGDTDTNAAVAGGLLGARDGETAVPERWVAALPAVDRLRELATRLARLAPASATSGARQT